MREHLTDEELAETLGGEPREETLAHLAECPASRAERDQLQVTLTALAGQARAQGERPEAAWERQRRQIASRLRDRAPVSRAWRWAWVPAAVALALVAVFWFRGETPPSSPGPETDHALLLAVERSLQADVPAALRPAALLAGEVEGGGAETEEKNGTPKGDRS
jgi:predicted anti-sigma-YlaC factor YlaD